MVFPGVDWIMEKKDQFLRISIYLTIVVIIFLALMSRLFYLQIVQNQQFKQLSENNRTRLIPVPARRGDILDSHGKVLATSKPVFAVLLTPSDEMDLDKTATRLAQLIADPEITAAKIIDTVNSHPRKYVPVEIARLPWGEKGWEVVSRIEEHRRELPGISIEEQPLRYYPNGDMAGHILGYVGKINENELEENRQYKYDIQDWIGKTGIERFAELVSYENGTVVGLRGKDGVRQVEVDADNRRIQELTAIPPTPGYDVYLTINADLQRAMEKSMDEEIARLKESNPKAMSGGAVLLDVKTGAVLAMASRPVINPNDFVDGSYTDKKDYYGDPEIKPLFNRVVQGTYPPGSTFKLITGMAALEAGVDPNATVTCKGAYWRPPYIGCWKVHGTVDFYEAVQGSCNTYFQEAGRRGGIDRIAQVGEEFGLGQKTGTLGILNEAAGTLPSSQWKEALYRPIIEKKYADRRETLKKEYDAKLGAEADADNKDKLQHEYENRLKILEAQYDIDMRFYTSWQPFDTYNTSIGQGSNNYTIMQMANYVATLANGGRRYRPYLVDRIVSPSGKVVKRFGPEVQAEASVTQENMAHARKGMRMVAEPGGTAYFLFSQFPPHIAVGAKTGTAQTGRSGDKKDKDFHGLFIAFAPYDDPEVAFAGIIEYGEHGGTSAGRVAKAVFEEYFGLNKGAEE